MTVAEAIKRPTSSVVLLAEVVAHWNPQAWVLDGTYTTTHKVSTSFTDRNGKTVPFEIVEVWAWNEVFGLGQLATEVATAADVESTGDCWAQDGGYLWVKINSSPTLVPTYGWRVHVRFHFSDTKKTLNNFVWWPRLASAPAISQRIEAVFGDVGQVGGGSLTFNNEDGFFSALPELQWGAGSVTLKLGVDLPDVISTGDGAMAYADYETLATWYVKEWREEEDTFEIQLLEAKARIRTKFPLETFSRDDFPNIDDDMVGKVVPIAYGACFGRAPVVVNPGTKTFKVAGHAIRSFDGVRLKKTRVELIARATDAVADWLVYNTNVRRYYLADETVKTVTFKGTATTEVNDVDDLAAGNWAYVENYVYVYPPAGKDWSAGTVTIESEQSSPSWVTANFASRDEANGEFTLGDDWSVGTDVAVDFRGKVDGSGNYLESAIDIIEDMLTVIGETAINSASFTAARAEMKIGTDEYGSEVHVLRPSLYVTEQSDAIELIGEVCRLARAYVFSDQNGEWSIGYFTPQPGEDLPKMDDTQILGFEKVADTGKLATKIIARYQDRPAEGFAQTVEHENTDYQYIANQPNPVLLEEDLPTAFESDAEYWAQAMLIQLGKPIAVHQINVPWVHMTLLPGDQVLIDSDKAELSGVYEVLEKRLDLGSKLVTLIVSDLRGFKDSPGVWVGDADIVPARFAALTGYGAGDLAWNSGWGPLIKTWARQNVGYWTDDNGFADPTDADSFIPSCWV